MITINQEDREERRKFLNRAAKFFDKFEVNCIYPVEPEKGGLYAVRNGMHGENIIVFRVAHEDVEFYANVIKVEG